MSVLAFVLSGCADVEHASLAEECSRDSCRDDAKLVYTQMTQINNDNDNNNTNTNHTTHATHVPKEWMCSAFYHGHNLLSKSYAVDLFHCLITDLETSNTNLLSAARATINNTNTDNTMITANDEHDIHHNSSSNSNILIEPPMFLLDTINISTQSTENIDIDAEDTASANSTSYKYLRRGDRVGYELLKQCVGVIDGMWLQAAFTTATTTTAAAAAADITIMKDNNSDNLSNVDMYMDTIPTVSSPLITTPADSTKNSIDTSTATATTTTTNTIAYIDSSQLYKHTTTNIDEMLSFCASANTCKDWLIYNTTTDEYSTQQSWLTDPHTPHGFVIDYDQLEDVTFTNNTNSTNTSTNSTTTSNDDKKHARADKEMTSLIQASELLKVQYNKNNNVNNINTDDIDNTPIVFSIPDSNQSVEDIPSLSATTSQIFTSVFTLLSAAEAMSLTGVTFNTKGRVLNIQPVIPVRANSNNKDDNNSEPGAEKEEDENWEDVDDEEDDEEEVGR